jgi:hypothetical protein
MKELIYIEAFEVRECEGQVLDVSARLSNGMYLSGITSATLNPPGSEEFTFHDIRVAGRIPVKTTEVPIEDVDPIFGLT